MIQLVTQYAGFGVFAEVALGLFFLAFIMILLSTFLRPKSQMQRYARMALSDDVCQDQAPTEQEKAEHGAAHHE
jgi:cbb3-type cytochrome oxidase subunit 3